MKGIHSMANFAKALKPEITKTNRKETKGVLQEIRERNASLRRLVAELRTRVFILERENKRLKATIGRLQGEAVQKPNGNRAKSANTARHS